MILTRGLPGSGKSTWSRKQLSSKVRRVNRDDIRRMLGKYDEFTPAREDLVTAIEERMVMAILEAGCSVIIDDCNLDPKYIRAWERIGACFEPNLEFIIQNFTDVPLRECLKRNATRQGDERVANKVIHEMYRKWLAPVKPLHQSDVPSAIICDLDGTLAIIGNRSPYDASQCDKLDRLNEPVAKVIRKFARDGHQIIFMSGRSREHEEPTRRFLKQHGFVLADEDPRSGALLHMRAERDTRKDSIVKQELYEQHVAGKFNVEFCIDDRDQIVDMWRSLGLTCMQVGEGWF